MVSLFKFLLLLFLLGNLKYYLGLTFCLCIDYLLLALVLLLLCTALLLLQNLGKLLLWFVILFLLCFQKRLRTPVVIPDRITRKITFSEFIPPFFIGTAIDIPSGMSCIAIVIASE